MVDVKQYWSVNKMSILLPYFASGTEFWNEQSSKSPLEEAI